MRISGTVTFTDNRSSTQNGLSFSSSGQMRVTANSALTVMLETVDGTGTYGYEDTLSSFTAFGTGVTWHGTLRPSNGTTYSFQASEASPATGPARRPGTGTIIGTSSL